MARTRSIKPGFFDNEELGDLPPLTRLLFIGLWCVADREGRLEDRPKRIKKELLGYDDVNTDDVDKMLQDLHNAGFIFRYGVADEKYIQIVNFGKHQNPHIKEKASEIPPISTCTIQAPDMHHTSTEEATPFTGNLLPFTGNLLPSTPQSGHTPGGDEENKSQHCESLSVKTADGAGREKPVDHSKTIVAKRFDEFWDEYPRKVGKGAAERAWGKIRPTAELHGKIMAALEKAKGCRDWVKDNGEFIPHPTTWLNQKRWEDDYGQSNSNTSSGGNPEFRYSQVCE